MAAILKRDLGDGAGYLSGDTGDSLHAVLLGLYNYAAAVDTALGAVIDVSGIDGTYGAPEKTVLDACRTKMNAVAALAITTYVTKEVSRTAAARVIRKDLGKGGERLNRDVPNNLYEVLEAFYDYFAALDAVFTTINSSTTDTTWGQQECDVLTSLRTVLNAVAALNLSTYLSKESTTTVAAVLKKLMGQGGGYLSQDPPGNLHDVLAALYDYFKALDTKMITVKTGTISNSSYDAATEAVLDDATNGVATIINTLATLSLASYLTKES